MMFSLLIELYAKYKWSLVTINKYMIYEKEILDIFNNKNINSYKHDKNLYLWIAKYYEVIDNNYNKMKKYCLMAIKLNDPVAMVKLGHYYHFTEINYNKMKKYYLMAIELNNQYAMINLAVYYQIIESNYDKMKEYYLMAIKLNEPAAMFNLAMYYQTIEIDHDKMMEYYLMAIKLNHTDAIVNLNKITTAIQRYIYYKKNDIVFNEAVTNDIHIYNNKLKNSKIDTCYICFEENQQCILLNCYGHYTCTICYINIYDKPCPFCRL